MLALCCLLLVFSSVVGLAETIAVVEWETPQQDGIVSCLPDQRWCRSKQIFPVRHDSQYLLHWEVRGELESGKAIAIFLVYDENERLIQPYHIHACKGSETILAAPCAIGDTTLKIKNNPLWKEGVGSCPAFGAQKDYSDLPNFSAHRGGISKITIGDEVSEITLSRPLTESYPAGMPVRQNFYASNLYFNMVEPTVEWQVCLKKINGISEVDDIRNGKWWPKTAFAKVAFFITAPGKVEFRNVRLEVIIPEEIF